MSTLDPRLDRLAELLAASPHNLVAARQRATLREDHIEEAARLVPVLPLAPGQHWVDLGTGGGLPGLVLACAAPEVSWLLVDARRKKADAVRAFAAELGLDNVEVLAERAEAMAAVPAHRGRYDGVVSRALGRLDVVAELSRGLLRAGGVVAAVKGPRWEMEARRTRPVMGELALAELTAQVLPSPTRRSWVVTMVAVGDVPAGLPRAPGVAQRRPIGGPEEDVGA